MRVTLNLISMTKKMVRRWGNWGSQLIPFSYWIDPKGCTDKRVRMDWKGFV